MQPIIPRSYLFVPANRPERFEKAFASGAHAVIIDLEDAVPKHEKSAARAEAAKWLSHSRPTFIRLNGSASEWFTEDLKLCDLPGVAGVLLAKCETTEEMLALPEREGRRLPVLPIIETGRGFWNALAVARTPFVDRLIFGSMDLQLDLGINGEGHELDYFRSQLVLVSRLAGISSPVDGVCVAINDAERLRSDTLRAQKFGFGAKLCIHPRQVSVINQLFLPSSEEVEWARRVVNAASIAGGGAATLDGTMIDRPIIAKAEAILRQTEGN